MIIENVLERWLVHIFCGQIYWSNSVDRILRKQNQFFKLHQKLLKIQKMYQLLTTMATRCGIKMACVNLYSHLKLFDVEINKVYSSGAACLDEDLQVSALFVVKKMTNFFFCRILSSYKQVTFLNI